MRLDPTIIRQQIDNLLLQFPEMQEDDALRADMIEGETEAFEFLSKVVRMIGDSESLVVGTKAYVDELRARKDRVERRIDGFRALAFKVMEAANLTKAELAEATLSIRKGQIKLVGEADPTMLPDALCKIKREVDRTKIKEALQAGDTVDGFALSNGEPSLAIRVK